MNAAGSESGDPIGHARRWLLAVLFFLYAAWSMLVALVGSFWFDAQAEIVLSELRGVNGWRLQLFDFSCTEPMHALRGAIAIYAGIATWHAKWNRVGIAVFAIAAIWMLELVTFSLVHERLLLPP
jgi:hypothetical protein